MYNAKQNKSIIESQIPCDSTHMWNLRNKMMNIQEEEKGGKQIMRLLTMENKLRVNGGRWVGDGIGRWVLGIKEGTC